ncbi:MAG: hypothetical protein AMXMBFR19_24500 [Chthonomonadaceae bacterium]|nr:MAG: hypothetical protein EDM74_10725 [Armatimonadota bacterium]
MEGEGCFRVGWEGGFVVERPCGEKVVFPTAKTTSLAAKLIFFAPQSFDRRNLAGEFWPDAVDDHARMSLRTALTALRRLLGEECVIAEGSNVGLAAERFLRPILSNPHDFAPEITDDWAEWVRGGIGAAADLIPLRVPVEGLLDSLDYLIDVDPASATEFTNASKRLLEHLPVDEVLPRLERLGRLAAGSNEIALGVRVFLATRFLAKGQFVPAIDICKGVVREAESRSLCSIAESAAYHLFASWVLLDQPMRARPYKDWLTRNGSTVVARMAEGMWSFQYEGGETTIRRLKTTAEVARDEGKPYFEQTALACLLSIDAASASENLTERLSDLRSLSGSGIGVFASAFSFARGEIGEGQAERAVARMAGLLLELKERGETRIGLGALHYTSAILAEAGFWALAAESFGAAGAWAEEMGVPFLASEKRERLHLSRLLSSRLSKDQFLLHVRRGATLWKRNLFAIG